MAEPRVCMPMSTILQERKKLTWTRVMSSFCSNQSQTLELKSKKSWVGYSTSTVGWRSGGFWKHHHDDLELFAL
ncbi:hypothetical protein M407DRAFT_20307 [Tulasnella calospora MUT 4182]|uniref:Uncharacterized protein n=1 Tax=Tulasnella calospora MUT 4182 TaxID=1051891 RepID=A0A0C3MA53_9AGAM|nr:hypothetical protein M407DRAFT_20307 [Tulasnella calospora MUT 4182]